MTPEEREQVKKLLIRWRDSIERFVEEALKATPSPQQRQVLQDIDKGVKDIAIKSGHGTGKTALLAWIALWVGLFKRDAKIPCTAPTAPQLKRLLLPEIRKWKEVLPYELADNIDVQSEAVNFPDNNFLVARTARKEEPEALQGFHASYLAWLIDEASGIPNVIFEVIDGSLTGERHLRILTGNPTRTDGYFYDAFHRQAHLWQRYTFNAEESPNVSPESIERKRLQYGKDSDAYRVRVLGEFPRSNTDAVIPLWVIEEAQARSKEEANTYGAEVWGLDYADAGDDRTVLVKRIGHWFYEVKVCPVDGKHRQVATANWLAHEYLTAKRKPKSIFIDAIGEGSGLISVLSTSAFSNIPSVPVKVSMRAYTDTYANLRAELYYNLKQMLEDEGKLPDNDDMVGELSAQKFKITMGGKIILEPKDKIKEELGRSPDIADAMALASHAIIVEDEELEELHTREIYDEEETWGGW